MITRSRSGSTIDHVISNFGETLVTTINATEISDHNVVLTFVSDFKIDKNKNCEYVEVKRIDYGEVNQIINGFFSVNDSYYSSNHPNEMVTFLSDTITCAVQAATKTTIVKQKRKSQFSPWVTKDIVRLSTLKKRLLRKFKDRTSNKLKVRLQNIDKNLNELKKTARDRFWKRKFNPKLDSKKLWRNLNEVRGKGKPSSTIKALSLKLLLIP